MIRSEESLAELIKSGDFFPYADSVADDRYPDILWTVLNDNRYDLLWVVLTHTPTQTRFIECLSSKDTPEADISIAALHINNMWNKYKDRLSK